MNIVVIFVMGIFSLNMKSAIPVRVGILPLLLYSHALVPAANCGRDRALEARRPSLPKLQRPQHQAPAEAMASLHGGQGLLTLCAFGRRTLTRLR